MTRFVICKTVLVKESCKNYKIDKSITFPESAYKAVKEIFHPENEPSEVFGVIYTDTKNKPISGRILHQGTIDYSIAESRDVIRDALLCNAANMIIFHNHPIGKT